MTAKKHRTLVRWIKRGLLAAVVLAVGGAVAVAWMPRPLPVETASVDSGALVVNVAEDGRTRVKDRYVVSAPLSGNLARIELQPGDDVEEGQVLARIVPLAAPLMDARTHGQAQARVEAATAAGKQAGAQIERARVALKFAEQELARVRPLVKQGIESSSALERAELDVRSRKAELASARFASRVAAHELQMAESALGRIDHGDEHPPGEQLLVTSPIAGRVLAIHRESEGVTAAGAPLVELGDPAALEIVVDVLTRDAVQIERGAPATIERWGGEPLKAKVRLIEPSAFTRLSSLGVEEQRVNAVLDLDEPYDRWKSLGEGYRVETLLTIWQSDDVLKIPSSALFRHDEAWAVFAVRDGLAELTEVEIGRRSRLEAQIVTGLEPGTRVIVHPSDRVEDGGSVTWR